ncbi:hypothetical protein, partial [Isoptericola rhizosphaerae]|uniref:hypothetical protein n=1 Tax=Isoptericola rhizosphaerae TaxID=3377837 RepID=UPI00383AC8D6
MNAATSVIAATILFTNLAMGAEIEGTMDDERNTAGVDAVGEGANPAASEDDGPRDRYFRTDTHTCNIATTADG